MKEARSQRPALPRRLFWDFRYYEIDWRGDYKTIIGRVLERGNDAEWFEMIRFYAAAASSAGYANLVTEYGLLRNGDARHNYYESRQGRIGQTLWQQPALYFKNSPVFKADKVLTPLLIMHNKADNAVNWLLGFEWFTALNSLGKKVWMLQYDNEQHVIRKKENQMDYSIRLAQFFDHYLKGKPAPVWMTRGIPAIDKGTIDGYALDPGTTP